MSEHSPQTPEAPSDVTRLAIGANKILGGLVALETLDLLASGKLLPALAGTALAGLAIWNDGRMRPQPVQQEQ